MRKLTEWISRPRVSSWFWLLAAVVGATGLSAVALVVNHHFYFVDDSQSSAFGQYYEIGRRLLSGDWSFIQPRVWQSGNYLAETSWGVFSPPLWIVGLTAHLATNVAVYLALVKLAFIALAAVGIFLLAGSFGARRSWSALVAVSVPLGGATVYLDSASWANGLMSWAWLPLTWWLVRRAVHRRGSILLAVLSGTMLLSISYVHATLMLAVVLVAHVAEGWRAGSRERVVRALVVGGALFLAVVAFYLPTLLTAPVSGRSAGIYNSEVVTVDLSDLAASSTGAGSSSINLFGEQIPKAPISYIAWWLPLLAFVQWRRMVPLLARRLSIVALLAVSLVIALGPSDIGPLRFPVRVLPFISLAALLALAIGLSISRDRAMPRSRFWVAVGLALASAYFASSDSPDQIGWILLVLVLQVIGLIVFSRLLTDRADRTAGWSRQSRAHRAAAAGLIALLVTAGVTVVQRIEAPRSPLREYGLPASVDDLHGKLPGAEGEALVIGPQDHPELDPKIWEDVLVGNLWYADPSVKVQNAYSTVYYPQYTAASCMNYNGSTCPELATRIFERQPGTGKTLADLFAVSTVAFIKGQVPDATWKSPPRGWHVAYDDARVIEFVRDTPVRGAGGVVWSSAGTKVTELHRDAMGVAFRVDSVSESGGRVALSRIPWPGYRVSGGQIVGNTDGFLMTIAVSASSEGKVVRVAFHSPGETVQLVAIALFIALLAFALVASARVRSSRGRIARWIGAPLPRLAVSRLRRRSTPTG